MIDMPKEDKVIDNTCNGKCSNCGQCCGLFIPFNDDDIKEIKKQIAILENTEKYSLKTWNLK